jgi:UDPglucose 6-dehydrogenase
VLITVVGCGYLGAVHAAALASLGHDVIGYDTDAAKVASLASGVAPFFEPGLPELLHDGVSSGRLRFTTDLADLSDAELHFVAVGTPQRSDGSVDLSAVEAAFAALTTIVQPGALVVGKSTVPPGTAARLAELVESRDARLAWNPEFLREGFAVKDSLHPDRIVYGVRPGDDDAVAKLESVYALLDPQTPRIVTDFATAELVKIAANAFLATKISFINAMAEVAEASGADVVRLAEAIGHDTRIGHRFLRSGIGFGGGCLPKDIRGFVASAEDLGVGEAVGFLREVDAINLRRRDRAVAMAEAALGGDVSGKRIAVLGLAFKPDSDDVRDSPALAIAGELHRRGAIVVATDPHAMSAAARLEPGLRYVDSVSDAIEGAETVLLLTEWREYADLVPPGGEGRVVIDGRNHLDADRWRAAGWRYRAPGRPDHDEVAAP